TPIAFTFSPFFGIVVPMRDSGITRTIRRPSAQPFQSGLHRARRRIMRTQNLCRSYGWVLLASIALGWAPSHVSAQIFGRSRRCLPCPPPECVAPAPTTAAPSEVTAPKSPTPPTPPKPPEEEPTAEAPSELPNLPMLASGVTGGRGLAYSSPNMWGDFFGTNPLRVTFQFPSRQIVTHIPPPPSSELGQPITIITTIPGRIAILDIPSTGGVVERTKISEDNSPLPRDR